jgi:Acetyltransferase (GNAT) domain
LAKLTISCFQIDPIKDARWSALVEKHPNASVFHTVGWLQALRRTYGYEPMVFTKSPPTEPLKNGLVFCRVKSWLTGNRLVSLPFSDHCEPLCDSPEELDFLLRHFQAVRKQQNWKYLEFRPTTKNFGQLAQKAGFLPSAKYFLHTLDLGPNLEGVFANLDKSSVRRRIQHAERAGLIEKCGTSEELLKEFYGLFVITRRRHHLPPPPYSWFRSLISCQREALEIRLAYQSGTPIAAILTLRFRNIVYYKYGCSDVRFNKFAAIPWLLWNAIAAAKSNGANEFDLGRTEKDNAGLLAFKNHWVPHPQQLVYWRFPESFQSYDSEDSWKLKMAKRTFSHMPSGLLKITGKLLYRHIG